MNLNVVGADAETIEVSEAAFGLDFNEPLVHQVLTAYMAAGRQGSKAQKTRSEVSGGGAKPWRQKGTGRARAGTTRGPIWRHGGVTFAAKPRDYQQKVNKKMYRAALRSIWSELVRQERLMVVQQQELALETHKTKPFVSKLKQFDVDDVLIVVSEKVEKNLDLASRNVPNVQVCEVAGVDPVSLVAYEKVMITVPALKAIEEYLA